MEPALRLGDRTDLVQQFDKIPTADKLERLDLFSQIEYKLQTIFLLEKILGFDQTVSTAPQKEKVYAKNTDRNGKRKESSFLGMSFEMLAEALQYRYRAAPAILF